MSGGISILDPIGGDASRWHLRYCPGDVELSGLRRNFVSRKYRGAQIGARCKCWAKRSDFQDRSILKFSGASIEESE